MIRRFARPYAKAVVDLAPTLEEAQEVRDDLRTFATAMAKVPKLSAVARNPAIPLEVKSRAVAQVADRLGLGERAKRLLAILLENLRLPQLDQVLLALDELIDQRRGVVTANVRTAEDLDEDQRQSLRATLEQTLGKKVEIELTVDPELLGGFVAVVGSERYDVSLAGQLNRLAERMASGGRAPGA